jgi:hypothetical protein
VWTTLYGLLAVIKEWISLRAEVNKRERERGRIVCGALSPSLAIDPTFPLCSPVLDAHVHSTCKAAKPGVIWPRARLTYR